jgi:DnaJ domain
MVPPAGFRGRMNPCHLSFETNHQARRWFEHHSRTSTAITATTIESCKFSLLLDSSSSRRNRSKARSPWSFPDIKVAATTTMIANRARLALSAFLSFIPLFKVTAFFWTSSRYPSLLPIGNKNGSAVAHGKTILHASVNRDTDRNFYRILQIDRKANTAEIKTAYRRLAKMYHPGEYTRNFDSLLGYEICDSLFYSWKTRISTRTLQPNFKN